MKRITEKSNKTDIIEKVYFSDDGFGSNKRTTEEAQKYNNEITADDIKKWKASQDFGQKAKPRGTNSFIVTKRRVPNGFIFYVRPRCGIYHENRFING